MQRLFLPLCLGISLLVTSQALPTTETAPPPCKKLTPRREWRTISPEHQESWLSAVKCLASIRYERLSYGKEGPVDETMSLYDEFAYAHNRSHDAAHAVEYFLPWHRWYLNLFDTRLRQICGYSGPTPYWDWTRDSDDLFHAPVFDGNPATGFGTNGDCIYNDCQIQDGALTVDGDPPHKFNFALTYPIPHPLRRNMSLTTGDFEGQVPVTEELTPLRIQQILTQPAEGDFWTFQFAIAKSHNRVHEFVGGDLNEGCPGIIPEAECKGSYSSNDPLFWLHHAQLDRIWSKWQHQSPKNSMAFGGIPMNITKEDFENIKSEDWMKNKYHYDPNASMDHVMVFDTLGAPIRVKDVFNHTAGGQLCYEYD